jgi:hypothetical protein
MNLTMLSDFMHVLNIIRKHLIKNEYFSYAYSIYYNLFIVGAELNHRNYFVQEINMRNFVYSTEYDMHIYAKFGSLSFCSCL